MKKRVILFYPKTGWDTEGVTIALPLSVLYLAAPLEADGVEVVILDERLHKDGPGALRELVSETDDLVVLGISAMTGVQISHGLVAAQVVREIKPEVPIVWGGIHPTIMGEQTLAHELVDYIVQGEGENSFRELVRRIRAGENVEGMPGVGGKRPDGTSWLTPEGEAVDLDGLPPLAYHLLEMPRYITTKILGERDMIIMASRGCPHNCAYCYQCNPKVNNKWRAYSPGRVVDMIEELSKAQGLNAIMLQDDLFFGRKSWVEEVCREILRRDLQLTFRADCRIDYINGFSDDFLRLVRKAGLVSLFIGVESGSDRILEMIHKNITAEDVRKATRRLQEFDIIPRFSFMAGFPGETQADVHKTLKLMLEVVEIHPQALTSNLQLYSPYPGTELWDEAVRLGLTPPGHLEEWGESNWNRSQSIWLTAKERNFLELASYFSYFIDGTTIASWYGGKPVMRFITTLLTRLLHWRVRNSSYRFIFVGRVLRWLKEKGRY